MRIFIAAQNQITESSINEAIYSFISKFKELSSDNFVLSEPDVIWFLTGGSEHNAIKRIEPQKKYCFIASNSDNSWASATEVKAHLNEKGIYTKIFDLDKLNSISEIRDYLYDRPEPEVSKLGMIGKASDWLVASIPEQELLEEVLDIKILKFNWEDVNNINTDLNQNIFESFFNILNYQPDVDCIELLGKLKILTDKNNLDALAIDCYSLINENRISACIPVSFFNTMNFPVACEGDLCSAAGMIVFSRIKKSVPWLANLSYVNKEYAIFSHCTVPLNILDSFEIAPHYESGYNAAIKGLLKKQQVTIFRIDHKLEYCFIALGEIVDSGNIIEGCKTQAKIKMSAKSLFLLREFPLGNHHLIVEGDHTDVLAEYFTNKGFRIF